MWNTFVRTRYQYNPAMTHSTGTSIGRILFLAATKPGCLKASPAIPKPMQTMVTSSPTMVKYWVPPPKPSLRPFVLRVGTIKIGYRAEQNPARRTIVLTIVRKYADDEKREDNCSSFWVWELKAPCNERLVEAVL